MKDMKNIWILTWWTNAEREISLISATAVRDWLESLGTYTIHWYDVPHDLHKLTLDLISKNLDFCFVMWHGSWFEDGQIVSLLDLYNTPYQCSPRDVLALTMNKYWTKCIWRSFDLPVAEDFLFQLGDYSLQELDDLIHESIWYPCVWKELDQWSSNWVHILQSRDDLDRVRQTYTNMKQLILLEQYIEWEEITIPILDINGIPTPLPLIHIIPPETWFNYENKYNGSTKEICPSGFDEKVIQVCEQISLQAYMSVWCKKYARVDAILTKKWPILLEINTIPWFTWESLFPKSAKVAGIEFPSLLDMMISQILLKE